MASSRTVIGTHHSLCLSIPECLPPPLRTTMRVKPRLCHLHHRSPSYSVSQQFILWGGCPKTSFVHIPPLCKSFRWLLIALKIMSAFLNPSRKLSMIWARLSPQPFHSHSPCSHRTNIFLLFHSPLPTGCTFCLEAALSCFCPFIPYLTHLFFRF